MKEKITSLRKTARRAGWLYLLIVLTTVYGHMYVPLQIFVEGDAAATAANMLQNELLFRSCIAAGLIETAAFLLLALTLHQLMKEVDVARARLMFVLVAVQLPVALVFAVLKFMAISIVTNNDSGVAADTSSTAMLLLNTIRYGSAVTGVFASLWLFPLGVLVYRSHFLPERLGMLLLFAASGSLLTGLMAVLFPNYLDTAWPAFFFFILSVIPMMLWLLLRGVRDHISVAVVSERKLAPALKSRVSVTHGVRQ